MVRRRKPGAGAAAWLVMACAATPAAGHDFWIEPSAYRVQVDQPVGVALRVGDHFKGQPVPRNPSRIVRFVSVGAGGESPIAGRDGADPAGVTRFNAAGTYILAYRSNHAFSELEAERFERYLEEKGLERIAARRRVLCHGGKKDREVYSRCSKSLILVGDDAGPVGDRVLGLPLEIVSESNPYEKAAGAPMGFRLLFDGRPLEGALVTATRRGAEETKLSLRTDGEGRATFSLGEGGVWLIASVHMAEAPKGIDANWESWWASLTFELPPPAAGTPRAE